MKDMNWLGGQNKKEETSNATISAPVGAGKDDNNVVESKNNVIYFYSEVTRPKVLQLNKSINEIGTNLLNQANIMRMSNPNWLHLHINSYGGSVFSGFRDDYS